MVLCILLNPHFKTVDQRTVKSLVSLSIESFHCNCNHSLYNSHEKRSVSGNLATRWSHFGHLGHSWAQDILGPAVMGDYTNYKY